MNARCRVQLLGALQIHRGDQTIGRFRTYKAGVLLGYLATYRLRPHPREEIVEMLWPEVDEALGRNSLSQCLSSLRGQLEPAGVESGSVLIADRLNLQLNPEAVTTDHAEFLEALKRAEKLQLMNPPDPGSFGALSQAAELYSGDFMPGYYETWNLEERERLKDLYLEALSTLGRHYEGLGDLGKALSISRSAAIADPLREDLHQSVIRYCLALGDVEGAKKQYRILKTAFRRDLGLDPSAETKALFKSLPEVSNDEPAPQVKVPSLPSTGALTIVVTRRDAERPVPEYELELEGPYVAAAFGGPSKAADYAFAINDSPVALSTSESPSTALDRCLAILAHADSNTVLCTAETALLLEGHKSTSISGSQPETFMLHRPGEEAAVPEAAKVAPGESSLPLRLSRFFGRKGEEDRILELLASGSRLVTITGPGGIGKTRLSIETAARFSKEVGESTHFADLSEVKTVDGLATAVTASVGLTTASKRDPLDLLESYFKGKPSLIVLDNFEQLIPEDGPEVEEAPIWVGELLRRCPECQALVTSRKRLGIDGEAEQQVGPLSVPQADDSFEMQVQNESVRLFVDRAQSVRPDLKTTEANIAAVAEICRGLDGMPLAIELAAARSQVLSPNQILERITEKLDLFTSRSKGAPDRHKTLRNAIDWSYQMLSVGLQQSFAMLSVFRGGFDVDAAEAVTRDPLILDKLADLREFSLLLSEEGPLGRVRFRMLETLRDFGREHFDAHDFSDIQGRHAEYFAGVAMEAEPHLIGRNQSEWLERLQADHENLLAALKFSVEAGDALTALQLCVGVWRFWFVRGHLTEGRQQMSLALAVPGAEAHPNLVAKIQNGLGRLAYLQGDYDEAEQYHKEALALCRQVGDRDGEALALNALGSIAYEQGDYEKAHSFYSKTLAIRRELGEEFGLANILNWLGIVLTDQCRYEEATEHLEESLVLRTKIGDHGGRARSLNSLAIISRQICEFERAQRLFGEALVVQLELGDRRAIAAIYSNLGLVAMNLRQYDEAAVQFANGFEAYRLLGDKWGTATLNANMGNLARYQGRLGDAIRLHHESLRMRMDLKNLWGVVYSFQGLAACATERKKFDVAIKLQAASYSIREKMGSPLPPVEKLQLDEEIEAARSQVTDAKFEQFWQEGLDLGMESAARLALTSL